MPDEKPNAEDAEIQELEKRLADASTGLNTHEHLANAHEEINKIDDDFHGRLEDLEKKAQAHKEQREASQKQAAKQLASDGDAARGLGIGMTVAWTLIGATLMGVGLGYLLQRLTGNPLWMALFSTAGMVVGIWMTVQITNRNSS